MNAPDAGPAGPFVAFVVSVLVVIVLRDRLTERMHVMEKKRGGEE